MTHFMMEKSLCLDHHFLRKKKPRLCHHDRECNPLGKQSLTESDRNENQNQDALDKNNNEESQQDPELPTTGDAEKNFSFNPENDLQSSASADDLNCNEGQSSPVPLAEEQVKSPSLPYDQPMTAGSFAEQIGSINQEEENPGSNPPDQQGDETNNVFQPSMDQPNLQGLNMENNDEGNVRSQDLGEQQISSPPPGETQEEQPSPGGNSSTSTVDAHDLEEQLKAGSFFSTYGDFIQVFQKYSQLSFSTTRIRSSLKTKDNLDVAKFPFRQMHRRCVHFGPLPKKQGQGVREHTRHMASGCSFEISLTYVKRKGKYEVKKFIKEHTGHETTLEAYLSHPRQRRLDEAEMEQYISRDYLSLNAQNMLVRKKICEETNKRLTAQDIINNVQKAKGGVNRLSEIDQLLQVLNKRSKGDEETYKVVTELTTNPDTQISTEEVTCIFYQSKQMKKVFEAFTSTIHVDATYKVLRCGYVLVPFLVIDNSGKSVLCAWAILSGETCVHYKTAFTCLRECNSEEVISQMEYAIIDKSAALMGALTEVFPQVKFVWCRFHAIQAVNRWTRLLRLKTEQQHLKTQLNNLFTKMVYAPDEQGYEEAFQAINAISSQAKELQCVSEYFETNWHLHRERWSFYLLKSERIFRSFTNNRTENFNQQIKRVLRHETTLPNLVRILFDLEDSQAEKMHMTDWIHKNTTYSKYNLIDKGEGEVQRIGRTLLSHQKLKDILIEYRKSKSVSISLCQTDKGQVKCPRISGICTFHANDDLPCQHIFAVRSHNMEPLLTKEMINDRWLIFFGAKGVSQGNERNSDLENDSTYHDQHESVDCNTMEHSDSTVNVERAQTNNGEETGTIESTPTNNGKETVTIESTPSHNESPPEIGVNLSTNDNTTTASEALSATVTNKSKSSSNPKSFQANTRQTPRHIPLPRQRYNQSKEACESFPEIVAGLCSSDALKCVEQLQKLNYHWSRNIHTKICYENRGHLLAKKDETGDRSKIVTQVTDICSWLPEML